METNHRYNDQYETYTEAIINAYFDNLRPGEFEQLSEQDKAELGRLSMLELEPYD